MQKLWFKSYFNFTTQFFAVVLSTLVIMLLLLLSAPLDDSPSKSYYVSALSNRRFKLYSGFSNNVKQLIYDIEDDTKILATDYAAHRVFSFNLMTHVGSIVAGTGQSSSFDSLLGSTAKFNQIVGLSVLVHPTTGDALGYIISEYGGNCLRRMKLSADNYAVDTVAGSCGNSGTTLGSGSSARYNTPRFLDTNFGTKKMYLADSFNDRMLELVWDATNEVIVSSRLAGVGAQGGLDSTAALSKFNEPFHGVSYPKVNVADGSYRSDPTVMFISERQIARLRKLTPMSLASGVVTTLRERGIGTTTGGRAIDVYEESQTGFSTLVWTNSHANGGLEWIRFNEEMATATASGGAELRTHSIGIKCTARDAFGLFFLKNGSLLSSVDGSGTGANKYDIRISDNDCLFATRTSTPTRSKTFSRTRTFSVPSITRSISTSRTREVVFPPTAITFPTFAPGSPITTQATQAGSGAISTAFSTLVSTLYQALSVVIQHSVLGTQVTFVLRVDTFALGFFAVSADCLANKNFLAGLGTATHPGTVVVNFNSDKTQVTVVATTNSSMLNQTIMECIVFNPSSTTSNDALHLSPHKLLKISATISTGSAEQVVSIGDQHSGGCNINEGPKIAATSINCDKTIARNARFVVRFGNLFNHPLSLPMRIAVSDPDSFPPPRNVRVSTNSSGYGEMRGIISTDQKLILVFYAEDSFGSISSRTCTITPVFFALTVITNPLPKLKIHAGASFSYLIPVDETFVSSSVPVSLTFVEQSSGFSLPLGVAFRPTGNIVGALTELGNFSWNVYAADKLGDEVFTVLPVEVTNNAPVAIVSKNTTAHTNNNQDAIENAVQLTSCVPGRAFSATTALSSLFYDEDGDALQFDVSIVGVSSSSSSSTATWLGLRINPGGKVQSPQSLLMDASLVPGELAGTNVTLRISCSDGWNTTSRYANIYVLPAASVIQLKKLPTFNFNPGDTLSESLPMSEYFTTDYNDELFVSTTLSPSSAWISISVQALSARSQAIVVSASHDVLADKTVFVSVNVSTSLGKYLITNTSIDVRMSLWQSIQAYVFVSSAALGTITTIAGYFFLVPILYNFFKNKSKIIKCPFNNKNRRWVIPNFSVGRVVKVYLRDRHGWRNFGAKYIGCLNYYVYNLFSLVASEENSTLQLIEQQGDELVFNPEPFIISRSNVEEQVNSGDNIELLEQYKNDQDYENEHEKESDNEAEQEEDESVVGSVEMTELQQNSTQRRTRRRINPYCDSDGVIRFTFPVADHVVQIYDRNGYLEVEYTTNFRKATKNWEFASTASDSNNDDDNENNNSNSGSRRNSDSDLNFVASNNENNSNNNNNVVVTPNQPHQVFEDVDEPDHHTVEVEHLDGGDVHQEHVSSSSSSSKKYKHLN